MSGAQSISTRRAYGVQRVCRVWRGGPHPLDRFSLRLRWNPGS